MLRCIASEAVAVLIARHTVVGAVTAGGPLLSLGQQRSRALVQTHVVAAKIVVVVAFCAVAG